MINKKNDQIKFFLCPASDYLNQYNETGSHGQISFQFIKHLAKNSSVRSIFGAVIMTLKVEPIIKTKIIPLINKSGKAALSDFDSLYFYIASYLKFSRSKYYKEADFVHHIIPFALGRSFNLFFLLKNKNKKYIIGPIIGPHINTQITADEEYVFHEKKSIFTTVKETSFLLIKKILLRIFGSVLRILSVKTIQSADVVLFSDNHAFNFHKKYLLSNQKGLVLDTGIDTNIFKPQGKKYTRLKNEYIRVFFVGRLTKRKGCEYLIRALSDAKKMKKDIKMQLNILGVGPLKEELEDLVKKLGLEKNVTFLGGVKSNEEIIKHYYKCDIVCLPALSETFTVTKEAMASGKPVIVTDVCSNAERVKPGVNGFVVPPQDSKSIAKVLVKISNDPSLIKKLSINAQKMRSLYDWDNIIGEYLKIIK